MLILQARVFDWSFATCQMYWHGQKALSGPVETSTLNGSLLSINISWKLCEIQVQVQGESFTFKCISMSFFFFFPPAGHRPSLSSKTQVICFHLHGGGRHIFTPCLPCIKQETQRLQEKENQGSSSFEACIC